MIWIFTLANKRALLLEALDSVKAQTRRDFCHVVQLDHGNWPVGVYPPARFFNEHAAKVPAEDYLCWLSDDDIWEPHYLEALAGYLDNHAEVDACYGGSLIVTYDPATGMQELIRALPAYRTYNDGVSPCGLLDGGQVMIRAWHLSMIEQPWVPEDRDESNRADGRFLERLECPIVPVVNSVVMLNRITPESSHWRLVNGRPTFVSDARHHEDALT